ncbi:hypothetical protein AAIB33_02165 [Microbacterium sp. AZCO]|uniref:hypothetical protein n=1 Tax=Microbacterium sp. AZCO TaxID=3142976 RepID=UPI0031F355AC
MSKRPLTDADRARIPDDAARLLAWLDANARPGITGRTLVRSRARAAEAVGLTPRQFARAEQALMQAHTIHAQRLMPMSERAAADPPFRWVLPYPTPRETP